MKPDVELFGESKRAKRSEKAKSGPKSSLTSREEGQGGCGCCELTGKEAKKTGEKNFKASGNDLHFFGRQGLRQAGEGKREKGGGGGGNHGSESTGPRRKKPEAMFFIERVTKLQLKSCWQEEGA